MLRACRGRVDACGWAQLLGRGFILQAAAQSCMGRYICLISSQAISRDLLLEETRQGTQLPPIPSLLPGSLLMINARTALVWGQEAWEDSDH